MSGTIIDRLKSRRDPSKPLVGMSASGQLGYGVIEAAFDAALPASRTTWARTWAPSIPARTTWAPARWRPVPNAPSAT